MGYSTKRIKQIKAKLEERYDLLAEWEDKQTFSQNPSERKAAEQETGRLKAEIKQLEAELAQLKAKPSSPAPDSPPKRPWLWGIPVLVVLVLGAYFLYQFLFSCREPEAKILIQVANFSPDASPTFSRFLVESLNSQLDNEQITSGQAYAYGLMEYIDLRLNPSDLEQAILSHTQRYCDYSGIVIYGDRLIEGGDSLFNCRIRLLDLSPADSRVKLKDKEELKIHNPREIAFQVEAQAQLVASFVLGNIFLTQNQADQAIPLLQEVAQKTDAKHKKLKFYCHLLTGNAYLQKQKPKQAFRAYAEAREFTGPTDTLLRGNQQALTRLLVQEYLPSEEISISNALPGPELEQLEQSLLTLIQLEEKLTLRADSSASAKLAQARKELQAQVTSLLTPNTTPSLQPKPVEVEAEADTPAPAPASAKGTEGNQPPTTVQTPPDLPGMVFVPGGSFQMGSDDGEDDEKPVHTVQLDDFYIGKYEVTQKQWREVMGENPSSFQGCDDCPVEQVSWNDVQEFIQKLNAQTGQNYRLPTEAEWEYAARGGQKSQGYQYAGSNNIDEVAWYDGNSGRKTHPVGQKRPNELGLYDMSGNVREWCSDWYGSDYYASSPEFNPRGPASGSSRVVRGGSWRYLSEVCRVAYRNNFLPEDGFNLLGLRLSRTL